MDSDWDKLVNFWTEASKDLGISVSTNHVIEFGGALYVYTAWIPNFGCKMGVLEIMHEDERKYALSAIARLLGHRCKYRI